MDDWDKFREIILPPKEAFYSKLAMAGVNEAATRVGSIIYFTHYVFYRLKI